MDGCIRRNAFSGRAVSGSVRGDAARIPLRDNSVDLIVTSPPYFALRSYQDGDEHYDGQIGSEPTPAEFIDALTHCTEEMARVLRPSGSIFVNLGDKYAGSGGHNNSGLQGGPSQLEGRSQRVTDFPPRTGEFAGRKRDGIDAPMPTRASRRERRDVARDDNRATRRQAPDRYNQETGGVRAKSLMGLPWRYALRCIDELDMILRAEIVWAKNNGLPESVTDRVRRSHEQWFHLVTQGTYYSAIDEIREEATYAGPNGAQHSPYGQGFTRRSSKQPAENGGRLMPPQPGEPGAFNPLGKLPGSVRTVNTEPLRIPEYFIEDDRGWRVVWQGKPTKAKAARQDEGLFDMPAGIPGFPGLVALWRYAEQRYREGLDYLRIASVDHFAAFPSEWPRWLILGWSPPAICLECDQGRWPVVDKQVDFDHAFTMSRDATKRDLLEPDGNQRGINARDRVSYRDVVTVQGHACACTPYTNHAPVRTTGRTHGLALLEGDYVSNDFGGQLGRRPKAGGWREYHLEGWTPPPSRPAVVLDPFGGTGTTAMVARSLGRIGISLDLSMDYARLARWRILESGQGAKALAKTAKGKQGAL